MPVAVVFYGVALFAAAGAGATYLLGERYFSLNIAACVLVTLTVLVDEKSAFGRSGIAGRPYEYRRNMNRLEAIALYALFVANALLIALVALA